ncbi:MAG: HAD family hydrolase [Planctomycetota bacterium]|nr:MAG: HAD family hydrolase [Planctomycetota bacterium]
MAIRGVSFDFHGTLALPYPSPGSIYAEVAAEHGYQIHAECLNQHFASAFQAIRHDRQPAYGADESDARDFWFAVIQRCFAQCLGPEQPAVTEVLCMALFTAFGQAQRWRLLPQAAACIQWCHQHHLPVVICSNFDARLHGLVRGLGLQPVHDVLPSSLTGLPKPDPELLLLASSLLVIEPEELLHVGDSHAEDGGAAQAAGCPWLAVSRSQGVVLTDLQQRIAELNAAS